MAMMSVLLSAGFVACGDDDDADDDDDSGEQVTSGNLLTSVTYSGTSIMTAKYDSKGNVTEFSINLDLDDKVTIYFTYDSSNKLESMKFWDVDEWTYIKDIEFTSAGNIKSFKESSSDGWYETATFTYDSNDRLTNLYMIDNDGEKTYLNLTWDNGCLTKMNYYEKDVVDDPDGPETYNYTFTYGDKVNTKKCYTAFCSPLMEQLFLTGFVGKGSDYLPASMMTDDEGTYGLNYTTDAYGKILTETVSNNGDEMNLIYNYGASSNAKQHKSAAAKQSGVNLPSMPCIFGKHK